MKFSRDLEFGVDTHTGRVRSTNEDDYITYCSEDQELRARVGLLVAVADGMGGASGGGEASRAAVRALAAAFAEAPPGEQPEARMERAFLAAARRIFELAREQPRLREMGTTLTAVNLLGDKVVVGHVGDTRCYLLRAGELRQLTTDHAVRRAEHQLTRCLGAGREREDVDVLTYPIDPGDVLCLATDGLWDGIEPDRLLALVKKGAAQEAALALTRAAVEGGGADNCTALLVRVLRTTRPGSEELVELEPPTREQLLLPELRVDLPGLRRARWPWVVLLLAVVILTVVVARSAFGFDLLGLLP